MKLRISPAGYILLVGDLVAFWLFIYYGKLIHNLPANFLGILETLTPFLIGWLVAVFVFRSYGKKTYSNGWRLLLSTVLTWTLAAPIGLILRSVWLDEPMTWIFTQVTYLITLAFLLGWRIPFAIIYSLRGRMRRVATRTR
jgi:Protein of unknown function (DUF3054)